MTSMIYGVSNNGKRGLGYDPPNKFRVKPKSKKKATKPKVLYPHFIHVHTHDCIEQKTQIKKNIWEKQQKWTQKDVGT